MDDIEIIALCGSGEKAIEAIRTDEPDLVFLDVQMPGVDGLEVVDRVGHEQMPVTVFVTAYDRYALVRLDRAKALIPRPRCGYNVELRDGTRLKISRSREE